MLIVLSVSKIFTCACTVYEHTCICKNHPCFLLQISSLNAPSSCLGLTGCPGLCVPYYTCAYMYMYMYMYMYLYAHNVHVCTCRPFEELITSWLRIVLHFNPKMRGARRTATQDAPCLINMDHILQTKVSQ